MTPRLIAFEGGEGCGKSTQAARLAAALDAVLTHEPGATDVGVTLRAIMLDPAVVDLDPRAEALLMAADRAQHVARVVRPALDAGRHVVTDRYSGSSLAYQGFGRSLPVDEIRWLSTWATADLWPDLTILLDVGAAQAASRLGRDLDRFEREDDGFHGRVIEGFRSLAAADPDRWAVVDGEGPVDEVERAVREVVRDRLQLPV